MNVNWRPSAFALAFGVIACPRAPATSAANGASTAALAAAVGAQAGPIRGDERAARFAGFLPDDLRKFGSEVSPPIASGTLDPALGAAS